MLEGVKVLFRFSLALIKMAIERTDQDYSWNSSGDLINNIRETTKNCYDFLELKRIAFNEIKTPKRKYLATKRAFYVKQINNRSELSLKTNLKESTTQWIRRRSSELLGLRPNFSQLRVVFSSDASKAVIFRKTNKNISDLSILCSESGEKIQTIEFNLKNTSIIGISNDGKKVLCIHSSKTNTKSKNGIKIELISSDFDAFDGFYFEDSDSVIVINTSGLVSKHRIGKKQTETSIILNDKNSSVVCADLNRNCGVIWLNTLSNHKITHKFISFDINSLDIFTVIETDFFNIEKFLINSSDDKSVIVIKSDPINGKLKKTIEILEKGSNNKRIFDFCDEVLDIKCFSFKDETKDCSEDSNENISNVDKILIISVVKNSENIYIEYKMNSFLKRTLLSMDKIKDTTQVNAIKIVNLLEEIDEYKVTLLAHCQDVFLFDMNLSKNNPNMF